MTEGRKREREIERYEISVFIKFWKRNKGSTDPEQPRGILKKNNAPQGTGQSGILDENARLIIENRKVFAREDIEKCFDVKGNKASLID